MKPPHPSLRQLRANLPSNVAILPSAATKQVRQPCNRAARAAKKALREGQPLTFPYKLPAVRDAEKRAEAFLEARNDPGAILALAIMVEIDDATRRRIIKALSETADESRAHGAAFHLASASGLDFGQQSDLLRALTALQNRLS